jgi:DNA-binding HxlR family transcriptional regulator
MRSAVGTLALLAVPLNGRILSQLSDGPKRLVELRDSASMPQTTVRTHLKALEVAGLMSRQGREQTPGVVECLLTSAGDDLLLVMVALEQWLHAAPEGSMVFDSDAGKMAIKALVGGWSSTILGSLASGPQSLSQLARGISTVSYPTLERRLGALRLAGLLLASPNEGEGIPYTVTEWLQQGIAPLAAAVRWERLNFPDDTPPMTRLDTETAFLLALPQLRMEVGLAGYCRVGVDMNDGDIRLCGAIANVVKGRVVSSNVNLEGVVDAWATGSMPAWGRALVGAGSDRLDLGGDRKLCGGLVDGLHETLFGAETPAD